MIILRATSILEGQKEDKGMICSITRGNCAVQKGRKEIEERKRKRKINDKVAMCRLVSGWEKIE
jgi:hypothetical protein